MDWRKLVPKQKELSSWLGGLSFLLRQTVFYFSAANLIMVTHVFYVTSPSVQQLFGSYWLFLVVLGFGLLALMVLEYMVMVPSMMKFQEQQRFKANRSPLWTRLDKIDKKLEELEKWLKENRRSA